MFAKPVKVLESNRRLEIVCAVDCGAIPNGPIRVRAALKDGERVMANSSTVSRPQNMGKPEARLSMTGLDRIVLWDVANPRLCDLVVTLFVDEHPVHEYRRRIGFREARFEVDGFLLNDRRLQLFGLNRHELYPYVGHAMPHRVARKDAEILKNEFNCNAVRCSHYPQSESRKVAR